MDFTTLLSSVWATPVNVLIMVLVVLYFVITLKEAHSSREIPHLELGIICGAEFTCKRLSAFVDPAERFEHFQDPEEFLDLILHRDVILIFIMKDKISVFADRILTHLQNVYDLGESLGTLKYAVFGVGNTTNEDFNALAIDVDLRLRKVGARRVVPLHLFDAVTSYDGLDQEFMDFVKRFAPRNVHPLILLSEISGDEESIPSDSENEPEDMAHDSDREDDEQTQQLESDKSEIEDVTPAAEEKVQRKNSKQEKSENEANDDDDDDWEVMEANSTDSS